MFLAAFTVNTVHLFICLLIQTIIQTCVQEEIDLVDKD